MDWMHNGHDHTNYLNQSDVVSDSRELSHVVELSHRLCKNYKSGSSWTLQNSQNHQNAPNSLRERCVESSYAIFVLQRHLMCIGVPLSDFSGFRWKKWDKTIKISIVSNFFLKKYFFNRSKVPENLYFSLSGPKTLIPRVNFWKTVIIPTELDFECMLMGALCLK